MDYVEGASLAELRRELSAVGPRHRRPRRGPHRARRARRAARRARAQRRQRQAAAHHPSRRLAAQRPHRLRRPLAPHRLRHREGRGPHPDDAHARGEGQARVPRARARRQAAHLHGAERRLLDGRRALGVLRGPAALSRRRGGRHPAGGHERAHPDARRDRRAVPRPLDDVIARALSRDLDTRYATALALAQAIERAAGPENIGTHADVARLMEAVFGARMAVRQNAGARHDRPTSWPTCCASRACRRAIRRPRRWRRKASCSPSLRHRCRPGGTRSGRSCEPRWRAFARHLPWRSIAAVAAGVAIGAVVTLAVLTRHPKPRRSWSGARRRRSPVHRRPRRPDGSSCRCLSSPVTRRSTTRAATSSRPATYSRSTCPPAAACGTTSRSSRPTARVPRGTPRAGRDRPSRRRGLHLRGAAPAREPGRSLRPQAPGHPVGMVHDGFTKLR